MSLSVLDFADIPTLRYIIAHVFCPLQLPDRSDHSIYNDHSLAKAIATAARLYGEHVTQDNLPQWNSVSRMLEKLSNSIQSTSSNMSPTTSQLSDMDVGDIVAMHIRAQNAGVIFRKQERFTIFESFELSSKAESVMETKGKLVCSYPGPAIEIPNAIFDNKDFRFELSNFLANMCHDDLHDDPNRRRQPYHPDVPPNYVTDLLTGILRSVGRPAYITRVSKRIGDDVVCGEGLRYPWRRSALWLLIRVALQLTIQRSPLGHGSYKEFILFFMCRLAEENSCAYLPSDLLQFMSAKISRRLRKLGPSAPNWLSDTVLQTCTSLRFTIENRWSHIRTAQSTSPTWAPSQLDLSHDTRLSLTASKDYLLHILSDHSVTPPEPTFNPDYCSRSILNEFLYSEGDLLKDADRTDLYIVLYDVETAVERGIDAWVDEVTGTDEACTRLEILANKYSSSARKAYENNQELLSVMLLTMIELWVALDKIVIKEIPMLADYSPEIPTSLLENLLIFKTASRLRVRRAHQYLSQRHSRSRGSVFSSAITADSFSVRFFRKSPQLRRLKAEIEEDARQKVREKIAELRRKNTEYIERRKALKNDPNLDSREIKIGVFQWPLPANQFQAQAIVFELVCPVSFHAWRSATFHLLVDLCTPSIRTRDRPRILLSKFGALVPYLTSYERCRVSLGSGSERSGGERSIPAKVGQVCVKNRMKFFGYDTRTNIPVAEALRSIDGKRYCTYKLHDGTYHNLQKYLVSTSHTSNEVIANQADCHHDLSIHEYMAFGHLRSGGLLQWLSILRELRGRSLSFRLPEVHMLFAQAVSQLGPPEGAEWKWHQEIQQPTFSFTLLRELESLIRDIEANWTEGVTMDTVSLIIRRLLASSPNNNVSLEALKLLRALRGKVFSWVEELLTAVIRSPGDEGCRGILRDTAAICRSTFDVDPVMIPNVLHSAEDVATLLSCAIIIHNHTPKNTQHLSAHSKLLLDRDRRLSLALENAVLEMIRTNANTGGINDAISRIWPDHQPGSEWNSLPDPNSHWIWCTSSSTGDRRHPLVHLNILDGSLLVDGRPLGPWLPTEILRHPLYKRIFGEHIFEVMPGGIPGMDYTTKELISDHQVYFSLRNGSDLVIQAKRKNQVGGDSGVIQLVPQEKLEGDLPAVLVEEYAHWLDLSTSIMEIRPLSNIWETSRDNWKTECLGDSRYLRRGNELLVDIRSKSWGMVSSLLKPLCAPEDLIVSVSTVDTDGSAPLLQLSVRLPRYDLSFYVDQDGDLQSRNIRGMIYDENQSTGTLFGLVNQLVLRPKIKDEYAMELNPRCVLIPDGEISFRMDSYHVRVEITSRSKRVTYQIFKVNTDLGCLTGNTSLTSKLYCAYLHALTSGSSIDPLTGRSGTEEALSILRSASCWSNERLSARDVELLSLIASIYPQQKMYSNPDGYFMVDWRNLPANSQHSDLYTVSKAIKEHHDRIQLFQENPSRVLFKTFPDVDSHIIKRGARRARYLFPYEFDPEQPPPEVEDFRCSPRHLIGGGELRAFIAASYVHQRTAMKVTNIWRMVKSLKKNVSGLSAESGWSLRYDKQWLKPNISMMWLGAYNLLRESGERKWFQLLFSMSAMAYASPNFAELVPVFVAFASLSKFGLEGPPDYDSYIISHGCRPSLRVLRGYIFDCRLDLDDRIQKFYGSSRGLVAITAARRLTRAWPCEAPPLALCSLNPKFFNVAELEQKIRRYYSSCFRNLKLKEHLTRVQAILNGLPSQASVIPNNFEYTFYPPETTPSPVAWQLSIDMLFTRPAPSFQVHDLLLQCSPESGNTSTPDRAPLRRLIDVIGAKAVNPFQQQYATALRTSAESFENEVSLTDYGRMKLVGVEIVLEHYTKCRASYVEALQVLQQHLGPRNRSEKAIKQSGQWPRITAHVLFRFLASNSPTALSNDWKKCFITLALLVLKLQRARRLLLLHLEDRREEFWREILNEGCDGWDAEAHPDWLLIQLQSNFLIRRVQADVANEMISPRSGDNTAMQLNMGEGKSSVIVPIIAAVLANGSQLVRVIVPKPLITQTLHLLTDRLGGLTNRRIYYFPFSRSIDLNHRKVDFLRQIMLECMEEGGILVVQPEHVLSLKLVSVEKQLSQGGDAKASHMLLELQKWLYSHSRDVMDESDEILHVRSQLIFTIGHQQFVEGYPERWTTTEQVLSLVSKHASSLRKLFPLGVEYEPGPPGSFPHLRILHKDAGEKLVLWIIQDVIEGHLPNLNFGHLRLLSDHRDAIQNFMLHEDVSSAEFQLVKEYFGQTPFWGGLLLLRGLLATGILLFAFRERRWRVDYGLAPERTMLAVPYRAKDVPAQRAEFGHPDIAIILTCLSYYYTGLTKEQLRLSFSLLFKQHDPSLDYELWVRECPAVPESLKMFSSVNMESEDQWDRSLFPLFSRNRATIDFYLSRVVFPREAKEFPSKLSSSGWDLAEEKERLVTGFSGTNDGQYLLPLHITQHDPDHQRGTNAKVLSYLLQPENNHYMCTTYGNDGRRTTQEFLEILVAQKPEIRVLLDVGAQMLDLQNHELAKAWLDITPDASAAIYFDDADQLTVRTRDGSTQLLLLSPYLEQLDRCIIYLDDAHTRGTDIKFPSGFRAAVTLGPKVTKDRLVQGCMRMRKLGHGHSVMFFAPTEVDLRIRTLSGKDKDPSEAVKSTDILHWAIKETWENIQRWAPHWVQQGMDHKCRYTTWSSFCKGHLSSQELSDKWLQPEAKRLANLYEPRSSSDATLLTSPEIRQRCIDLGMQSLFSIGMDEEQERELVYELERQVERPSTIPPAGHSIHQDVVHFVQTGVIPARSKIFRMWNPGTFHPAFETLHETSAAICEGRVWSRFVLATKDFEKTVELSDKMDDYLRPVHWIVSTRRGGKDFLVIFSPHEVNCLLPRIRSSRKIHLHLYTPRMIKSMKPCDDLALYSTPTVPDGWIAPSSLIDQLNIFAGQLYLKDSESYFRLCRFLCVYTRNLQNEEGIHVEPDGFILPENRPRHLQALTGHTFTSSPLVSIKALMNIRCKGIDFKSTHMGKILRGQLLSDCDFDD